jgi:hemoglobin-like flavoprotein
MSPEQIALVQSSFDNLVRSAPDAGKQFYLKLFGRDPRVKDLFRSDLDHQAHALVSMLGAIVESLDKQDRIVPMIYELGKRHAAYGVAAADYAPFGTALLETLDEMLGAEFTPAHRQAWGEAYDFLAEIMQEAGPLPS